jgi:transcription initiation factor TFIIB
MSVISQVCNQCMTELSLVDGDLLCRKCGIVYDQHVSDLSTDYDMTEDGKGGRVGPQFNPKFGMPETTIGHPQDKGMKRMPEFAKIHKIDRNSKMDMIKIKAISFLKKMSESLALGTATEERAVEIFNECRAKKLLRGRDSKIFVTGALYAATKENNIPRSFVDFCRVANISRQQLTRAHHTILETVEMRQQITGPEKFLAKLKNSIAISLRVENHAKEILKKYSKLEGKDPRLLLAAAVYIASLDNNKITQRELAMALECSDNGIRFRVKDMQNDLGI